MLVTHLDPNDVSRQIANSHTLFNVINVILLLPFSKLIVKLTMKLVPEGEDEVEDTKVVRFIDERMITTPSIALSNTSKETLRMGNKAKASLENAMNGLLEKSEAKVKYVFEEEAKINKLQKTILDYLLKLSKTSLNHDCIEGIDKLFNTINDIERVGDHAENIAELAESMINNDLNMSDKGKDELIEMFNKVVETYTCALEALEKADVNLACKVIKMEEQVDAMESSYRRSHMNRLNFYDTKIGKIGIAEEDGYIIKIYFENGKIIKEDYEIFESEVIKEASSQLNQYLNGKRKEFNLPLKLIGTEFRKNVWNSLKNIPYGHTSSYKEVAISINNSKACRAVGMANNTNPIPIIIPCHRVIGSNNKLVGYAGGLEVKEFLLNLEKENL